MEPLESMSDVSTPTEQPPKKSSRRLATRFQVKSACSNCKRRHAGCDYGRPCSRCVKTNKADSCTDVIDLRTKKAKEALGISPNKPTGAPSRRKTASRLFSIIFLPLSPVPKCSVQDPMARPLSSPSTLQPPSMLEAPLLLLPPLNSKPNRSQSAPPSQHQVQLVSAFTRSVRDALPRPTSSSLQFAPPRFVSTSLSVALNLRP